MSTTMKLEDLMNQARQRADMVNSQFITDPELIGYINQSAYELHDLLIQKYGENYYVKTGSFSTDGQNDKFSLQGPISGNFFTSTPNPPVIVNHTMSWSGNNTHPDGGSQQFTNIPGGDTVPYTGWPDGLVQVPANGVVVSARVTISPSIVGVGGIIGFEFYNPFGGRYSFPSAIYPPGVTSYDLSSTVSGTVVTAGDKILVGLAYNTNNATDPVNFQLELVVQETIPQPDTYGYDEPKVSDFYKLLGVDLKLSPYPTNQQTWITVRPFTMIDRNRYAVPNMQSFYGLTNLRYRINGEELWFTPVPTGGQTIRYHYIPRMTEMRTVATASFKQGYSWTANVDQMFLEHDGQQTIIPIQTNSWGGVDISQLKYDINAAVGSRLFVSASDTNNTEYINNIGDGTLYLWSNNSSNIRWDFTQYQNDAVVMTPGPIDYWTGILDGISGWTEYVIVDAAIKMMQKEESDPSALMMQKQNLIARIEAAAANRDAGSPAVVSDSQWSDSWWTSGGGWGYGGGGY